MTDNKQQETVQRYDIKAYQRHARDGGSEGVWCAIEADDGDWVGFNDHAQVIAEKDAEIKQLKLDQQCDEERLIQILMALDGHTPHFERMGGIVRHVKTEDQVRTIIKERDEAQARIALYESLGVGVNLEMFPSGAVTNWAKIKAEQK